MIQCGCDYPMVGSSVMNYKVLGAGWEQKETALHKDDAKPMIPQI